MNKTAIKRFAIEARKKLMASVIDRAGLLGITPEECREAISTGAGFAVFQTTADTEVTLYGDEIKYRKQLVNEIKLRGFEAVVEEVAYTWFNRIIAIRFMEVNDYLPTRLRVLSSEKEGKIEPDLLTLAPNVEIEFSDEEIEYILTAKSENKLDELFRMLFIKQCQELHKILPELFEKTNDYTEMLLNISFTNKDDVVRMLVDEVEEENFDLNAKDEEGNPIGQVEIIGWLYQYYNTELKDDTFALLKKNVKITKERIPAATQLFTPDWIVRYMVENSLGRLWIEHLRANDPTVDEKETAERFGWKYYLPEAEQEEQVNVQLAEIRTSYKDLKPTDILCIDPCMGSGHILVYMFDVLMDIYKSVGYSERDAAFEIVEHNIRGLDIDKRAYQLAYFAVMMKGRGYNRRFFRGIEVSEDGRVYTKYPSPMLCAIQESNVLPVDMVHQLRENFKGVFTEDEISCMKYVQDIFRDAKEYGSILNIDVYRKTDEDKYNSISIKLNKLWNGTHEFYLDHNYNLVQILLINNIYPVISRLLVQLKILCDRYDIVATNPPYMASSGMNSKLSNYIKMMYENSKHDMYAIFIEKSLSMINNNGYIAMITQHSWMFLSSFEALRKELIKNRICNIVHLGIKAFEEIGNDVVQTCAFVVCKDIGKEYISNFVRLVDYKNYFLKESEFFNRNNLIINKLDDIVRIPNSPIAYWVPKGFIDNFTRGETIEKYGRFTGSQNITGNNEKYLRFFWEIDKEKIDTKRWVTYAKGGDYRKYYGNTEIVIDWSENARNFYRNNKTSNLLNEEYWFEEGITYSAVTSRGTGFRYLPNNCIFDKGGPSIQVKEHLYEILAILNSKVAELYFSVFNPSINLQVKDVKVLPIILDGTGEIEEMSIENVDIAKEDWDYEELSYDFSINPLIKFMKDGSIEASFNFYVNHKLGMLSKIRQNEIKINKSLITTYGLDDFIKLEFEDRDFPIRIPQQEAEVKKLVNYIIGCMFGRYSIAEKGIVFSGSNWDLKQYKTIIPCSDNIIPITDEEYFNDDILNSFVICIGKIFGESHLEENLDYIANVLGNKGASSRECIRKYFLDDYYRDQVRSYQKRPIYWLFDSGKENAFKALIYMHRYNADTVGRIRTEYLHKTQIAIENSMKTAQYIVDNTTSASEKSKATKQLAKLTKQLAETRLYDQALAHVANQRIEIDLDDGVKVNYAKFQGIEIAQEGKKPVKIDLLAKIK